MKKIDDEMVQQDNMSFTFKEGTFQFASFFTPNAISKIQPYILTSLVLTAVLTLKYDKLISLFFGEIVVMGLFYGTAFYLKHDSFYDTRYLIRREQIKLGDKNKGVLPNVQDADIFQPTTKQRTFTADAIVVAPTNKANIKQKKS
jgi:hypothetical protein